MGSPDNRKSIEKNRYNFGWLFSVLLCCVGFSNLPKKKPQHTRERAERESL